MGLNSDIKIASDAIRAEGAACQQKDTLADFPS
jgi:hypothetical protein